MSITYFKDFDNNYDDSIVNSVYWSEFMFLTRSKIKINDKLYISERPSDIFLEFIDKWIDLSNQRPPIYKAKEICNLFSIGIKICRY